MYKLKFKYFQLLNAIYHHPHCLGAVEQAAGDAAWRRPVTSAAPAAAHRAPAGHLRLHQAHVEVEQAGPGALGARAARRQLAGAQGQGAPRLRRPQAERGDQ